MANNIKVAVRVRPFNEREKRKGELKIVSMRGGTTFLTNPDDVKSKPREFTFDYSYWSHDGYKIREDGYAEPTSPLYTDQIKLFNDLGKGMLDNAWEGYNSTIFAYGQTGSGKSYSIMGHGPNKGLVPRVCEELFNSIEAKKKPGVNYEISFSMLEIYNEKIRDLLNKAASSQGLKIKMDKSQGFYAEGLMVVPVGNYRDIKMRMDEGDRQRTIAATKMNDTSSRAHTVVTISFQQRMVKEKVTKHATINLVDLAGSERAKQTEAKGARFEEAKNINKSLLTLGNVIESLCEQARGKNKNVHVPYRNSVLTQLLKNALGGNSKTVMMAAIGPDAENYEQTLSTLRYADRAKQIKTQATVNQTATDKLIKELIMDKERLLKELESAKAGGGEGYSSEELEKLRADQERELEMYKLQMQDQESAWKQRLEEARKELEEFHKKEMEMTQTPHLSNLNEDPALTNKLLHTFKSGKSLIGNGKDKPIPDVILNGVTIAKQHAVVTNTKGKVLLKPTQGMVKRNGQEVKEEVQLIHQDRIMFGGNNLFVFIDPVEVNNLKKKGKTLPDVTYEFAMSEIGRNAGLDTENDKILEEEVARIMQLVLDCNTMAEELEKIVDFKTKLLSAEARGMESGRTEVCVQVTLGNSNSFLWDRNKFLMRQSLMNEMYAEYEETGVIPQVKQENDPFWEPADTEVIVGIALVPLNYLSHMVELEDHVTVLNYWAETVGYLNLELRPCDSKGNEDTVEMLQTPIDMINTSVHFKLKLLQGANFSEQFEKTWCKYRFYNDADFIQTEKVKGSNPRYNFEHFHRISSKFVDHKFVDFLCKQSLVIEIWGQQKERQRPSSKGDKKAERQKQKEELSHLKKENQNLQEKLDKVHEVTKKMEKMSSVKALKEQVAIILKTLEK